jgi:hypothetical protein
MDGHNKERRNYGIFVQVKSIIEAGGWADIPE